MNAAEVTYFHDPQTDHDLIGLPLQGGLLLVLHEDTVATYEVRGWDPERYQPIEPFWTADELRKKMLEWPERIEARHKAGLS